jgi:hypothetical protein
VNQTANIASGEFSIVCSGALRFPAGLATLSGSM